MTGSSQPIATMSRLASDGQRTMHLHEPAIKRVMTDGAASDLVNETVSRRLQPELSVHHDNV
jgi:hypothetical protein